MAILDSLGTSLLVGGQASLSGYIVERQEIDGGEVDQEDIMNANGSLATRLIYRRHPTTSLALICAVGAAPSTDFPFGSKAAANAGSYSSWFVQDVRTEKTKSASRVTVTLISLGIT